MFKHCLVVLERPLKFQVLWVSIDFSKTFGKGYILKKIKITLNF